MKSGASTQRCPGIALKHVHIIGTCGTLMGSFASFLRRSGVRVSGSDQNIYPPMSDVLREAGVELLDGYRAENLTKFSEKPDLVVIGNVVRPDNPEARHAIDQGYTYCSLPEFMEKHWLPTTRNLVVSGTHGKTTTASMLGFVLRELGKDPAWLIGGVPDGLPSGFFVPEDLKGTPFVIEGDEYDTAFWDKVPKFNHYLPDEVILTSIEHDHVDIYKTFDVLIKAFEGLISRIRPGGSLIACTEYSAVREILAKSKVGVLTYGKAGSPAARFTVDKIRCENGITRIEILDQGKRMRELSILLPGEHNALNALSVFLLTTVNLGLDEDDVADVLSRFKGVKRRQEVRGEPKGVLVIDDFAHHPTAVRETLKALKLKYPDRRLIAVFEPRSNSSRRRIFQKDYANAFGSADAIYIAKPQDLSRIDPSEVFSSDELVADLNAKVRNAESFSDVPSGVSMVARASKSGDVVAVLSNGGFGGFIPLLLQALT